MKLDPKALEAAVAAVADSEGWNAEDMHITRRTAQAAVLAYLNALGDEPVAYEHVKLSGTFKTPMEYEDTVNKANYRPLFASPQLVAVSEEKIERAGPFVLSAEMRAEIEAEREDLAAKVAATWRDGLTHKDWLFDGSPIRGRVMVERFNNLDWENAWIDLGPSVAGNLGPYWHVPLKETIIDGEVYDHGDTVHRLYPRVLQSKWALLILQACNEAEARGRRAALAADGRRE